jgi:hypothetical protein
LLLSLLFPCAAHAGPATTSDALDRLEEILELRLEDGQLAIGDVMPAILVSTAPRYEASEAWFGTRSIEVLQSAFGTGGLRICEACMAPRTLVHEGQMEVQVGPATLDEIVRLDEGSRGTSQPARSAIWLDEHAGGVSLRIVDLRNAQVLFAQNVDPGLVENANTAHQYTLSEELERRARGDSLTQAFVDVVMYPGQHLSLDWTEQWGAANKNLSGVVISVYDPILGIGLAHYRCLDALHALVGGKIIMSLPSSIVRSVGETPTGDVLDPLLTAVGLARVPFGRSNYGLIFSLSTNGEAGVGLSLMNISVLPVIP